MKLTIIIILLIISATSKAVQDKINFHFEKSVFRNKSNWWNASVSWKNKHEWFKNSKILTWLISNPLVAITDAWHFFGLLRDFSIFACIPIISGNYYLFLLYPVYRFVFHVFFKYFFAKK